MQELRVSSRQEMEKKMFNHILGSGLDWELFSKTCQASFKKYLQLTITQQIPHTKIISSAPIKLIISFSTYILIGRIKCVCVHLWKKEEREAPPPLLTWASTSYWS